MNLCKWAVAFTVDGKFYDDGKERTSVTAVFRYPCNAEDFIAKCVPAENRDRFFVVNVDELEKEKRS